MYMNYEDTSDFWHKVTGAICAPSHSRSFHDLIYKVTGHKYQPKQPKKSEQEDESNYDEYNETELKPLNIMTTKGAPQQLAQ